MVDKALTRRNTAFLPISAKTVTHDVAGFAETVHANIKTLLHVKFGLVIDGWRTDCTTLENITLLMYDLELWDPSTAVCRVLASRRTSNYFSINGNNGNN